MLWLRANTFGKQSRCTLDHGHKNQRGPVPETAVKGQVQYSAGSVGLVVHVGGVSGQNAELERNLMPRKSASKRRRVPKAPTADIGARRRDRRLRRQPLAAAPSVPDTVGTGGSASSGTPSQHPFLKRTAGFRSPGTLRLWCRPCPY